MLARFVQLAFGAVLRRRLHRIAFARQFYRRRLL